MQKAPFVAGRGRGQHWIELVSLKKHWTKQKQKTNSRNKVLVNPKVQNQIKTGFKLELCSPHNNTYRTLFLKTTFYVLFSRNRIIPLTRILFHLATKKVSFHNINPALISNSTSCIFVRPLTIRCNVVHLSSSFFKLQTIGKFAIILCVVTVEGQGRSEIFCLKTNLTVVVKYYH